MKFVGKFRCRFCDAKFNLRFDYFLFVRLKQSLAIILLDEQSKSKSIAVCIVSFHFIRTKGHRSTEQQPSCCRTAYACLQHNTHTHSRTHQPHLIRVAISNFHIISFMQCYRSIVLIAQPTKKTLNCFWSSRTTNSVAAVPPANYLEF